MKLDAICARLKSTLNRGQDKVIEETNNNFVKDDDEPKTIRDSPVPDGESRRKRRKNIQPRFLVQPPAEESNPEEPRDDDVDADDDDDDDDALDLSSSKDHQESSKDFETDTMGVMDLSTTSKTSEPEVSPKPDAEVTQRATNGPFPRGLPASSSGDVLKTYAESTMKELLSMYGFDNDEEARSSFPPPSRPLPVLDDDDDDVSKASSHDSMDSSSQASQAPKVSNFATSAAYINACFDPSISSALASSPASTLLPSYNKYIRRFATSEECGKDHCQEKGYKEHFHCLDCNYKVILRKEEMIRHFKWHKKRDDSLQHGFLRFSPIDDCSEQFASCTHNGKQTHYHCIQPQCSKVYISTSDVQMHANYHRKDSAIIQEGFQRFRATEDCGTQSCPFYSQRTTHFHCRREGCSFTFKNKADMEKHKTYHQKDEMLAKDGFKKFMKYEHCSYAQCRYSKVSNHIHCIRESCDYVLHSTGQLYSHKRKHERRDFENAYKTFKGTRTIHPSFDVMTKPTVNENFVAMATGANQRPKLESEFVDLDDLVKMEQIDPKQESSSDEAETMMTELKSNIKEEKTDTVSEDEYSADEMDKDGEKDGDTDAARSASPQTAVCKVGFMPKVSPPVNEKKERDETWKKYLTRYTANDPCHSRCTFLYKDHYHCTAPKCGMLFRSKDGVRDHARHHDYQDRITELSFRTFSAGETCSPVCKFNQGSLHFHCLWGGCNQAVSSDEHAFMRLEHYKIHEFARASVGGNRKMQASLSLLKEHSRRRRGRPPKYPRSEIPLVPKIGMTEKEIEDEAKCFPPDHPIACGFRQFQDMEPCPDDRCLYYRKQHYHCVRLRCHHSTDRQDVLTLHARDFHNFIHILEGFEFFDRHINCRRPHCHNNRANRHYHCVRPKCDYSFVRYSTMAQHDKKHKMAEMGLTPSPSIGIPNSAIIGHKPEMQLMAPQPLVLAPPNMVAVSAAPVMLHTLQAPPVKTQVSRGSDLIPIAPKPTLTQVIPMTQPLSVLLQKRSNNPPQMDWKTLLSKMHFSQVQLCGRPFCKLKKREHYHCFDCNQAFSDPSRLRSHVAKHGVKVENGPSGLNVPQLRPLSPMSNEGEEPDASSSLNLNPQVFSNILQRGKQAVAKEEEEEGGSLVMDLSQKAEDPDDSTARRSGRKRTASKMHGDVDNSDDVVIPKKRLSSSSSSSSSQKDNEKADVAVEGFQRFRFVEDCGYEACPYRFNLSHYHCMRNDCGYAFCDKARLKQHTERHKRLDNVMGDDFQQYRPKVDCQRPDCEHAKTANHFHCVKCPFICTDSSKVTAHRKHHINIEEIRAKGFEKFTATETCNQNTCCYSGRQTHYHCTKMGCNSLALSPTQMHSHNSKHLTDS